MLFGGSRRKTPDQEISKDDVARDAHHVLGSERSIKLKGWAGPTQFIRIWKCCGQNDHKSRLEIQVKWVNWWPSPHVDHHWCTSASPSSHNWLHGGGAEVRVGFYYLTQANKGSRRSILVPQRFCAKSWKKTVAALQPQSRMVYALYSFHS